MIFDPYKELLTPEEAVQIARNSLNFGHMQISRAVKDAWYTYRATQKDWLKNDEWEATLMLAAVFVAGMIFGVRFMRYRKRKKGLPVVGAQ